MVTELKYGNTNTYLIKGNDKYILFDTDWAGTFNLFCKAIKEKNIKLSDIEYLMISHFHPDHMGIAGQLAENGIKLAIMEMQKEYIHYSDSIFEKEKNKAYVPIDDARIQIIGCRESRQFLEKIGINGEIIHTPGHSDDSISLWLDEGALLVGDLNPLYELQLHEGTQIGDSWHRLLEKNPNTVYYGHAKTAHLNAERKSIESNEDIEKNSIDTNESIEKYSLVSDIIKYIDKGYNVEKIQKKTGADRVFIDDVMRMYLTHRNVSVQGILDRIEIKNK